MNKKTIIAIIVAGVLLLGSSGVYATGQIARSNAIGESDAINFACVDAGVSPNNINVTKIEFDFDHGRFVYEIEFVADGIEYDYVIDSANGDVLGKDFDIWPGQSAVNGLGDTNVNGDSSNGNNTNNSPNQNQQIASDIIGIEKAKEVALASAGYKESDVVFSKAKLDRENGKVVYDIEFYVFDKAEYSYEIDATSGSILEESFENWEQEDYAEYAAAELMQSSIAGNSNSGSGNKPATSTSSSSSATSSSSSSKPAASASSSGSSSSSKPATSSSSSSSSSKPATSSSSSSSSSKPATTATVSEPSTISVDQAKSIAFSYAGVSSGAAVLEKAKLEREGGTMVYEIEFYVPGDTEYDVDVDAYSGAVLSYDYERLYSPSTVASSSASSGSQTSQSYNQYYDDDDDDWDDHDDDDDWDDDDDDWDDDDD